MDLQEEADRLRAELGQEVIDSLSLLDQISEDYSSGKTDYLVRGNKIEVNTTKKTLSGLDLPRVALPTSDWGDRVRWIRSENLPGAFPYTRVFFLSNARTSFQFGCLLARVLRKGPMRDTISWPNDQPFNRLSVAFDSPSLYGHDPATQLDIFGKVCESGVSISTIDEMERLFDGFNLCAPETSVSMTINGNYWWHLAAFFRVAQRQQIRIFARKTEESRMQPRLRKSRLSPSRT